ncbi:hypothetical protein FOB41_09750 [Agrobacterium pusense]|uniref:Uncharacterized protein n=1 Tax=Agrobacterium pusense TaxID=648995 RepID=A0A6H0ZNP4_9HYPH|nr:ribosome modulation factor [Agrobacterium pusense]QIX21400.1 hypothetical protein FOB41_09750 [Agrobacterium pusense]
MSGETETNAVFQAGYDACMRGQSYLTHPEGKDRNEWLNGWRKASEDYAEKYSPKPTHVTVPVEDIKRLEAIESAARRLANIVRKSVNAGPVSNDPTSEGQAWRQLRRALGEETSSTN